MRWEVLRTERVLDERWARVRKDVCRLPDGRIVDDYYLWEGVDFAVIFALTPDDQVVLIRQYHHGAFDVLWELPAGAIDPADASAEAAAERELREETGFVATVWQALGPIYVSPGKLTTRAHLYLARQARRLASTDFDEHEAIETECVTIPRLLEMIQAGELRDAVSIGATLRALQELGRLTPG